MGKRVTIGGLTALFTGGVGVGVARAFCVWGPDCFTDCHWWGLCDFFASVASLF
jgi:hypothetical protein